MRRANLWFVLSCEGENFWLLQAEDLRAERGASCISASQTWWLCCKHGDSALLLWW